MRLLLLVYISSNIFLYSQSYSLKGQFWASGEYVENQSDIKFQIGYIPTLSLLKSLDNNQLLDIELSYRLSSKNNIEHFHRYWIRYSSNQLEARLGLQKIDGTPRSSGRCYTEGLRTPSRSTV